MDGELGRCCTGKFSGHVQSLKIGEKSAIYLNKYKMNAEEGNIYSMHSIQLLNLTFTPNSCKSLF